MLTIITYDVPDDRRRTKPAHALKDFGERVQYSVFECHLDDGELQRMRSRLLKLLDLEDDSLRIYRACAGCERLVEVHGLGRTTEDRETLVL